MAIPDHIAIAPADMDNKLVCMYCGAEEGLEMGIGIELTIKAAREFSRHHNRCERPQTPPSNLRLGQTVRVYSLMNPRRDLIHTGKIRELAHTSSTSPLMAWIEGLAGGRHPASIEVVE